VVALAVVIAAIILGSGGGPTPDTANRQAQLEALSRIDSILGVAAQGRRAIQANNFNGAIANRRAVLQLIDNLPPVPPDLVASLRTLRAAEAASLRADTLLGSCGVACSQLANDNATALKQQFAARFNPVAVRYATPVFSPDQI
jgi:hypothetical protein